MSFLNFHQVFDSNLRLNREEAAEQVAIAISQMHWGEPLLKMQEYIKYLVECMSEVVFITTPQGEIELANSAASRLIKTNASSLVGRSLNHFLADQQWLTTWLADRTKKVECG
ncbi:MAG TPA: hypothetical protein IGS53_06760 [Leptolyngbyaceae cyanobacterium M33_DOE_097]|uniref:PAS domain-containing protein n=1 Tax=Oscillatoriales cyanobacterium SpSt-418 TaxID=2282169 RepID=A0A7C3KGN3_9CYAN|nr:hypothetical protein [Leptolyngbyaceae cyanobacterium M33_DOE_097]